MIRGGEVWVYVFLGLRVDVGGELFSVFSRCRESGFKGKNRFIVVGYNLGFFAVRGIVIVF